MIKSVFKNIIFRCARHCLRNVRSTGNVVCKDISLLAIVGAHPAVPFKLHNHDYSYTLKSASCFVQ